MSCEACLAWPGPDEWLFNRTTGYIGSSSNGIEDEGDNSYVCDEEMAQ